jgi:hypothetical protein
LSSCAPLIHGAAVIRLQRGSAILNGCHDPNTRTFFVADQNNGTIEAISESRLITFFATGFVDYPRDIEFDRNGNMYVSDSTNLYKITPVVSSHRSPPDETGEESSNE